MAISLVFLILLAALPVSAAAQGGSIEAVAVRVQSSAVPPPAKVAKRMEVSVATVGEHVLIGRKTDEVAANRQAYEKLIKEIFDRVLVGYSVEQVDIVPGQTAQVTVRIVPWGDVVRDVAVEMDFGGSSPQITELIKRDVGDINDRMRQVLVGLPIDAVDWAGGVSKSVIRELLAEQLPEFRANLEIVPGQTTAVKISLTPAGPLVRDVRVTIRSKTIPNVLLLEARPALERSATIMRGLPVAFVERHGDFFKNYLTEAALKQPVSGRYNLELDSSLNTGTETELVINADTTRYKVTLEGYLDFGKKEDNTSARLHIGKYFSKTDELFLETTFITGTMAWEFAPGWGHRIGPQTEAGLKYNFSSESSIIWLKQDLAPNWSLRLERMPSLGRNELAIRYKLHDFLSAEYIFTSEDKWLRLVGNL